MPNPYSEAMLDYWRGDVNAAYTIYRDDGWSQLVPVAAAFAGQPFNPSEQLALDLATGRVLDVGAGVGRHSFVLQSRLTRVTSIEIEPELVTIMSERGITDALAESVFTLASREFDTILMLMNGFGLVGNLNGAAAFFQHARSLLSPTGFSGVLLNARGHFPSLFARIRLDIGPQSIRHPWQRE